MLWPSHKGASITNTSKALCGPAGLEQGPDGRDTSWRLKPAASTTFRNQSTLDKDMKRRHLFSSWCACELCTSCYWRSNQSAQVCALCFIRGRFNQTWALLLHKVDRRYDLDTLDASLGTLAHSKRWLVCDVESRGPNFQAFQRTVYLYIFISLYIFYSQAIKASPPKRFFFFFLMKVALSILYFREKLVWEI